MPEKKILLFKDKKVIVFDLDGTIVRLAADWHSLKNVLNDRYSEHFQDGRQFTSISSCLSEIVEKGDEAELQRNFDVIKQYELDNIEKNEPIEETIYFINNTKLFGVKRGTKLAILSLNTRQTIKKSLELARISDKFDFILGREDVRSWKPEPEGLLRIMEHYKVNKEDMIYFGDLEKDLATGANAGIEAHYIDDLINLVKSCKNELK
ncbi:Phosphoglycolate phosphatase [subsurface metagenome]